jgi:hypothetical protein
MIKQIIIFLLTITSLISCFNSFDRNEKGPEPILAADREAPIGWVIFKAYPNNTFEYSLSSRHQYKGTFKFKNDTLFLICTDTTIGIDTAIIRDKSVEFLGKKSPRFASITINKLAK